MEKIFGRNMLQDEEMKPLLDQLTGIQEEKPFECVGSRDEINSAIVLTIERMEKRGRSFRFYLNIIKKQACMSGIRQRKISFPLILTAAIWCLNPGKNLSGKGVQRKHRRRGDGL